MNPTIDDVRQLRAEIPGLSANLPEPRRSEWIKNAKSTCEQLKRWIRIEKAAFEPEFVIMVEELCLEVEAL